MTTDDDIRHALDGYTDDAWRTANVRAFNRSRHDLAELSELILAAPMRMWHDAEFKARVTLLTRILMIDVDPEQPPLDQRTATLAAMRIVATQSWLENRIQEARI